MIQQFSVGNPTAKQADEYLTKDIRTTVNLAAQNDNSVVGLYFVGTSTKDGDWVSANGEIYSLEFVL